MERHKGPSHRFNYLSYRPRPLARDGSAALISFWAACGSALIAIGMMLLPHNVRQALDFLWMSMLGLAAISGGTAVAGFRGSVFSKIITAVALLTSVLIVLFYIILVQSGRA